MSLRKSRARFAELVCSGPGGQTLWQPLISLVKGEHELRLRPGQIDTLVDLIDDWAAGATRADVEEFLASGDPRWRAWLKQRLPDLGWFVLEVLNTVQARALVVVAVREAMDELGYDDEAQQDMVRTWFPAFVGRRHQAPPRTPRLSGSARDRQVSEVQIVRVSRKKRRKTGDRR